MSFRYEDSVIVLVRIKRKVRSWNKKTGQHEQFYELEALNGTPILSPIREAQTAVQTSPRGEDESG